MGAAQEEFRAVEHALENLSTEERSRMTPPWASHYASLKMRQGNLYLVKDFRPPRRLAWEKYENRQEALNSYRSAKDKTPDSVFVKFSLAQAMSHFERGGNWKDLSPEELFRDVFYSFRNDAVVKTEPILLTTLYYCAAISCFHAKIHGETPSLYLMQARQHLQRVPANIRVFSPLNKISMNHQELLEEMKQLELWWQNK